jgi:hypothetical protein
MHESSDPTMVVCHLFLILDWNLILRADFVVEQNIDIVGIINDAILFDIGVTKSDQEGTKHQDHPAHVYACPENPVICILMAFGKYLTCHPGNCPLFEGSNQYSRFNKIMKDIVTSEEHREEFKRVGLNPELLWQPLNMQGSHHAHCIGYYFMSSHCQHLHQSLLAHAWRPQPLSKV